MTNPDVATDRATWRAWLGLGLLVLPSFMMATDITMLFLVMPALTADLAPSTTQMLWILHIGEFAAAGLVITMGRLTDKIGRRRLLLLAMATYAAGSGLAALSTTPEMLLIARVLIGAATAAASPAAITLVRSMFVRPREFGIAFAILMGTYSVGATLGPPLGGLLLEHFSWASVFLVNIPVALAVLLAGRWLLPTYRDPAGGGVDILSVVLSTLAVLAVVFGLQEIAANGLAGRYVAAIAGGLGLGVVFLRRQRRLADPLLDLSLFANRAFAVSAGVLFGTAMAFMASDMMVVQYLQVVVGMSMTGLGLLLGAAGAAAVVGTVLAPVALRRLLPSTVLVFSLVGAVAGAAIALSAISFLDGSLPLLVVGTTLGGLFSSPVFVVAAQLVVTSAPARHAGSATAVQDLSAGTGGAAGLAMIGSAAMVVFARVLRADAPAAADPDIVDAATQSVGGALAAGDLVGGALGQQLRMAVESALTGAAQATYLMTIAVALGVAVVALRGLRGVRLPDHVEGEPAEVGAAR
ncbi:MAG TPA: MFS transporter [Actinomycetaceae bacterium]|nr:MFS transporter [Actinomycetaceae bacterium]